MALGHSHSALGMPPSEVEAIVRWLHDHSVIYQINGGWAVDALVGKPTRAHRDVDVFVDDARVPEFHAWLSERGYEVAEDWHPVRVEWAMGNLRVDVHPMRILDRGDGVQRGFGEETFLHRAAERTRGRIGDSLVIVANARRLAALREGYEPRPEDHHDLAELGRLLSSTALHPDELAIDRVLVQKLIERDAAPLAHLPLTALDQSGSSNALFRLGSDLLVRLPRQPGGGADITREARWLPDLAHTLAVPVPEVVALGSPGFGYPEPWAVTRWIDGDRVPAVAPGGGEPSRKGLAVDLADVVLALRSLEVPDVVPEGLRSYRGDALAGFDASTRRNLEHCRSLNGLDLDLAKAEQIWSDALTLPGAAQPSHDSWFHGDLVAENLLERDGRLAAVLDWGGLSIGDPTVDLHGAWEVLDASAREVFALSLGVDEPEWLRGRAWALGIGLGALAYYWTSMPTRREDRLTMVRNVIADV